LGDGLWLDYVQMFNDDILRDGVCLCVEKVTFQLKKFSVFRPMPAIWDILAHLYKYSETAAEPPFH
jgi:hypothetical protein